MRFNGRIHFEEEVSFASKLSGPPMFGEDGDTPKLRVLEVENEAEPQQESAESDLDDPALASLGHLLQGEADLLSACYPACDAPEIPSMVAKRRGRSIAPTRWLIAAVFLLAAGTAFWMNSDEKPLGPLADEKAAEHSQQLGNIKPVKQKAEPAEPKLAVEHPVASTPTEEAEPISAIEVEHVLELDGSSLEGLMDLEEEGCLQRAKFSL